MSFNGSLKLSHRWWLYLTMMLLVIDLPFNSHCAFSAEILSSGENEEVSAQEEIAEWDEDDYVSTDYELQTGETEIDFDPLISSLSPQSDDGADPSTAAALVISHLTSSLHDRLTSIFEKATTAECRAKIATHFSYFLNAIGEESAELPFVNSKFENTCPEEKFNSSSITKENAISFEKFMHRKYQPPGEEAEYIADPKDLRLLYGILMHGSAQSTLRLIDRLYEEGHTFVIHVDGKEASDEAYKTLVDFAADKEYVHIVPNKHRVRVNWGGYSMVNATMQLFKHSLGMLDNDDGTETFLEPIHFHKFVHLSSSTYPLKSNTEIRNRLASYPLDANMLWVIMKPLQPDPSAFHYYVECDDALHRVYRLPPLKESTHGVEIYTSSQWFVISPQFMEYLAKAERGTFVHSYIQYAQHAVVADETFFGTVLRNTAFCTKHHNENFLHLQFDRWESELGSNTRDEKKCLSPNKDHCGKSPTTLDVEDYFVLELSDALFARKFSEAEPAILDLIDDFRTKEEIKLRDKAAGNYTEPIPTIQTEFEGHGTLIVAKETINSKEPLCMGIGPKGHKLKLVPCFHDAVVPTLSEGWETGGVIEMEILHRSSRWAVGPCSSDGSLKRRPDSAEMESKPGNIHLPHCMIKQFSGLRAGRCLDVEDDRIEPGGQILVYPCNQKWHQMFGFGNEIFAPKGSIYSTVPKNIVRTILRKGKIQEPHLCIGVSGRGTKQYEAWTEDADKTDLKSVDFVPPNEDLFSSQNNVEEEEEKATVEKDSLGLLDGPDTSEPVNRVLHENEKHKYQEVYKETASQTEHENLRPGTFNREEF